MDFESNIDSTRKLASIRTIESVVKHPNADALEIVTLQDMLWQVVTRLGDVKVGDKVIYFEIDSLLPTTAPWFPTALGGPDKVCLVNGEPHFRVKTIKLRKEISQGLILPLNDALKQVVGGSDEGIDLTQLLQVKKFEPNVPDQGHQGRQARESNGIPFPSDLVSKTDETRVQSCKSDFIALFGRPYYITVKCDGSSGTFLLDPQTNQFLVCSRNFILPPSNDNYWRAALKYNLEAVLRTFAEQGHYYAIQGEVCGPKIQKNLLGLSDVRLFIFNMIDLKHRQRLPYAEMARLCVGLECVPLVEQGEAFAYSKISEMLALAQGYYPNTKNHREGIVVRGIRDQISFKVI